MWTLRKRIDAINSKQDDAVNNASLVPGPSRKRKPGSRGQTLVEFAVVLPVFFMLLCGVMDYSHIFYVKMTVQNALREAGRYATTGNHQPDPNNPGQNLSRVNSIIATAQQAAPGISFTGINVSSVNGGAGSAGGPGDIVTISLSSSVPVLTPVIAPFFPPNGAYPFTVSVTFKNEPFAAGQTN
jgi:Flp pilus assembly protein TadG